MPPRDIIGVETFSTRTIHTELQIWWHKGLVEYCSRRERQKRRGQKKRWVVLLALFLASFPGSPRAQTRNRFSVLQVTESWPGAGKEATLFPYFRLVFQTPPPHLSQVSISWSIEKCRYLGMRLHVSYTRKWLGTNSVVRWLLITECGLKGCCHSLRRFGVSGKVWWRNTCFLRGKSERSMFDSMLQCVHKFQGEFLFITGQNNNYSQVFRKVSLYVQGCQASADPIFRRG